MVNAEESNNRITKRRAKNQRRKKRNWVLGGIASAIVLYLLLSVIFSFYSSMSTMIAMKGAVEESVLADGYVIRKQQTIPAPAAGYLECRVNEGDRVTEGQILGYVYTGDYDPERSGRIRELSARIAQLENTETNDTYAANGVMVEQKIASAARSYSDMRQDRDMSKLNEQAEELSQLIERKHAMNSGGSVDKTEQLNALKQELYDLEISTGGSKHPIVSPASGVFSAKIDGMEDKLIYEDAEGLTPADLKELDGMKISQKENVVAGEPVCKIVDNYGWYFVAALEEEQAKDLWVGETLDLRFFDFADAPVEGTVRTISQPDKGRVAVAIHTNRYVEGIYASSRTSADLVTVCAEGIKLPVESIHVRDGQTGVYVLRLDVARFVPVDIRYKNEDWAIVSAVLDGGFEYRLQIYDEVIVEAKKLEDGKVVR